MTKIEDYLKEKGISRNTFEKALSLLVECIDDGSQDLKVEVEPVEYPPGFFRPDEKEIYFWTDTNDGEVEKTENNCGSVDENLILFGNCYRTESEAQQALDQRRAYAELVRKIAELNHREGWDCDWEDEEQDKHSFYIDNENLGIETNCSNVTQEQKTELYFKPGLFDELLSTLTPEKIKLALWGIR
jgi:hypothetical protein